MTRASDTARLLGAGATILDGTTISTADNTEQLTLTSTDADANAGPEILLDRNSSSPADSDRVGKFTFKGRNDANQTVEYGNIQSRITDASDGTEDGRIIIQNIIAGDVAGVMESDGTETIFNNNSKDLDFRIESDNSANAFFVQGSDGNVGIGTSSPSNLLSIDASGTVTTRYTSTGSAFSLFQVDNTGSMIFSADHGDNVSNSNIIFKSDGATEHMRIDSSGRLLVGATNVTTGRINSVADLSAMHTCTFRNSANNTNGIFLRQQNYIGQDCGNITQTGSTTVSYGTSSDYRLKENVSYDFDATTRLKQLKPCRFNFIADGTDKVVDGFLAHEAQTVVPESVVGEKNAVDDDNNPILQQIDQSKLVPLLVKTIQELEARITTLENA